MKLIIDIPEEEYEFIVNDEACGLHYLTRAIANGTPIPDNATNGEVIRAMFPKMCDKADANEYYFDDVPANRSYMHIESTWWSEPYQKGGMSAEEIEHYERLAEYYDKRND